MVKRQGLHRKFRTLTQPIKDFTWFIKYSFKPDLELEYNELVPSPMYNPGLKFHQLPSLFIYSCKNGDFNKYGNVFYTCYMLDYLQWSCHMWVSMHKIGTRRKTSYSNGHAKIAFMCQIWEVQLASNFESVLRLAKYDNDIFLNLLLERHMSNLIIFHFSNVKYGFEIPSQLKMLLTLQINPLYHMRKRQKDPWLLILGLCIDGLVCTVFSASKGEQRYLVGPYQS